MAKIHYKDVPCGAKSWSESLGDNFAIIEVGRTTPLPDTIEFEDYGLPQTDNWGEVTCKRCLNLKPDDIKVLKCEDCHRPYGGNNWIDVVLPDKQWGLISGHTDGGGILCGCCIIKRAAKVKGWSVGKLTFE